jgi:hypothetical protein
MNQQVNQHFIDCPFCKKENDVSPQVYLLNKNSEDVSKGARCKHCGMMMTLVITMCQGLQTVEGLTLAKHQ